MIFICSRTPNIPYTLQEPYHILTPTDYPERPNISDKESYRHLRQMYFIWKNLDLFDNPTTITIYQERRHLQHSTIPEGYDVIQPNHQDLRSISWQWQVCSNVPSHSQIYFDILLTILPRMKEYATISPAPSAYFHNMGTYTTPLFNDLCSFLFSTLTLFEDQSNLNPTEPLGTYAFLAERIQNLYFWEHPSLNVFESPVRSYRK